MKQFSGFPARMQFTPVPNIFFSRLLPQISDIAELKTMLHIFKALYLKRGHPRFITYNELLSDVSLINGIRDAAEPPEKALRRALEMAVQRETILHIVLDREDVAEDVYFLNNDYNKRLISKIKSGELELNGLKAGKQAYISAEEHPDVFTLYEQNIGMLTPMIADELREAEKLYPVNWVKDAIKEAVSLNKRNWRYIARILERWSSEGKSNGTYSRDFAKKADPDKFFKGKYGHMVQR